VQRGETSLPGVWGVRRGVIHHALTRDPKIGGQGVEQHTWMSGIDHCSLEV
jgi:hypothetical protein